MADTKASAFTTISFASATAGMHVPLAETFGGAGQRVQAQDLVARAMERGGIFNVLDYGAVPDARFFDWEDGYWYTESTLTTLATDNATAFADTIAAAKAAGGGIILVPGNGDPVDNVANRREAGDPEPNPLRGAYAVIPTVQAATEEGAYPARTKGFAIDGSHILMMGSHGAWIVSQGPAEGGIWGIAPGNGGYPVTDPGEGDDPDVPLMDLKPWSQGCGLINLNFDQRSVPTVNSSGVPVWGNNSLGANPHETELLNVQAMRDRANTSFNYYESTGILRKAERWIIDNCTFRLCLSADGVIVAGNGSRKGILSNCTFDGRNYGNAVEFDGGRDIWAFNNTCDYAGGIIALSNNDNGITCQYLRYVNNVIRNMPAGWGLYKSGAPQGNKSSKALGINGGWNCLVAGNQVDGGGVSAALISFERYTLGGNTLPAGGDSRVIDLVFENNTIYDAPSVAVQLSDVTSGVFRFNTFLGGTNCFRVGGTIANARDLVFYGNYSDISYLLRDDGSIPSEVQIGINYFGPNASGSSPYGNSVANALPNGPQITIGGELLAKVTGDLTDTTP